MASDAMRCTRQGDAAAMRSGWELSENGGIGTDRGGNMKADTMKRCVKEAKRFIKLASDVEMHKYGNVEIMQQGKASGAMVRASMDLTRALADLRQGR